MALQALEPSETFLTALWLWLSLPTLALRRRCGKRLLAMEKPETSTALPDDLEDIAIRKFDALRREGQLFHEEPRHEILEHRGFLVRQIRLCSPSLVDHS